MPRGQAADRPVVANRKFTSWEIFRLCNVLRAIVEASWMERFAKFGVAGFTTAALLASCSIVDVPISTATGLGVAGGSTIAFVNEDPTPNELRERVRNKIKIELIRAGYQIEPKSEHVVEFAIANRPAAIGILLPESEKSEPEAGSWRSRPVDRNSFALCRSSIFRVMIVVSRKSSGEILFKGSSDDDLCGEISDQTLRAMVASALAGLRGRQTH